MIKDFNYCEDCVWFGGLAKHFKDRINQQEYARCLHVKHRITPDQIIEKAGAWKSGYCSTYNTPYRPCTRWQSEHQLESEAEPETVQESRWTWVLRLLKKLRVTISRILGL